MNNKESLLSLITQLIFLIRTMIKATGPKKNEDQWQNPEIWEENIIKDLESLSKHYKERDTREDLAEILIGFAKYFDYYSLDWAKPRDRKEFHKKIKNIVSKATKILSGRQYAIFKKCGKHEDTACHLTENNDRHNQQHAVNFYPHPIHHTLKPGDKLIRIIGIKNTPYGSYWFLEKNLPESKEEWRSLFAVLSNWNDGTHYVILTIEKEIQTWRGTAANQKIPYEKCFLTGGGQQIWIKPNIIKGIKRKMISQPKKIW